MGKESVSESGWQGDSLLARRFDVLSGNNRTFDRSVFAFEVLDCIADKHENMAVYGTTFIISDIGDLLQHFILDTDRHTLNGHSNTPFEWLYGVFILCLQRVIMSKTDIRYIYNNSER